MAKSTKKPKAQQEDVKDDVATASDASDTTKDDGAKTDGSDAAAPTQEGADSVDKSDTGPAEDPLKAQQEELDTKLGAMYDELVTRIKDASAEGANTETAEQMRAGAVQFLRECNAVLASARQTLTDTKKVSEDMNASIQSIEKAKVDLQKRSDAYTRMTTGGVKNGQ